MTASPCAFASHFSFSCRIRSAASRPRMKIFKEHLQMVFQMVAAAYIEAK